MKDEILLENMQEERDNLREELRKRSILLSQAGWIIKHLDGTYSKRPAIFDSLKKEWFSDINNLSDPKILE